MLLIRVLVIALSEFTGMLRKVGFAADSGFGYSLVRYRNAAQAGFAVDSGFGYSLVRYRDAEQAGLLLIRILIIPLSVAGMLALLVLVLTRILVITLFVSRMLALLVRILVVTLSVSGMLALLVWILILILIALSAVWPLTMLIRVLIIAMPIGLHPLRRRFITLCRPLVYIGTIHRNTVIIYRLAGALASGNVNLMNLIVRNAFYLGNLWPPVIFKVVCVVIVNTIISVPDDNSSAGNSDVTPNYIEANIFPV